MHTIEQLEAILKALREQLAELQNDRNSGVEVDDRKEALVHRQLDQYTCLLYTSPSPRDGLLSRMPSSA